MSTQVIVGANGDIGNGDTSNVELVDRLDVLLSYISVTGVFP